MDPALHRLLESVDPAGEVAVLVRTATARTRLPGWVREVSRFGDIRTVRVPASRVPELRARDDVASVKAPRFYGAQSTATSERTAEWAPTPSWRHAAEDDVGETLTPLAQDGDERRPAAGPTGRGVVVGVIDWGLDVTHPAFRRPDGGTRIGALWDQKPGPDARHPNRFGYGRIHTAADIDRALAGADPFGTLGYGPQASDPTHHGSHGTATASIAAGSAWRGGVSGVAPDADLVFVHLGTPGGVSPDQLGDSVALVEALDFVLEQAGDRSCVVNMSMGRQGGAHLGTTHVERALDVAALRRPGVAIVQSAGNYYGRAAHTSGTLVPTERARLELVLGGSPTAEHSVEIWYPGADRFAVDVRAPGSGPCLVRPGATGGVAVGGRVVATVGHRLDDPNNGRNQVEVHLPAGGPKGTWTIDLIAVDVVDGRYDAWIERDRKPASSRLRFVPDQVVRTTTTGSIANGLRTVTVGAYDAHDPDGRLTDFSSSGPTADGRRKPDVLAAGRDVLVARSAATSPPRDDRTLGARTSGTSMAAPAVAGVLACMLEALGPVPTSRLRYLLLDACAPYRGPDGTRAGNGYLDVAACLQVAVETARGRTTPPSAAARPRPATRTTPGRTPAAREAAAATTTPAPRAESPTPETEPVMSIATDLGAVPTSPSSVLALLDVDPQELASAYVLGRAPEVRARLAGRVETVLEPFDLIDGLRAGDILVRSLVGEGATLVSVLLTGHVVDLVRARALGWEVEDGGPGGYARVVEDGVTTHPADDRFARRVADRSGVALPRQAVLRVVAAAGGPGGGLPGAGPRGGDPAADAPHAPAGPGGLYGSGEPGGLYAPGRPGALHAPTEPSGLYSPAEPTLDSPARPASLFGRPFGAREGDDEEVDRRSRAYVMWYQAELNRVDGATLTVDGAHGTLTRRAVIHFQRRANLVPDGVVGPLTENALIRAGASQPPGSLLPPPIPVPPLPVPPGPVPPGPFPFPPVPVPVPGSALAALERRYFPPQGTPDAARISRASELVPLIDGTTYFPEVQRAIDRLGRGDVWWVTGWLFDHTFRLVRGGPTVGETMAALVSRGVDVRVILWASHVLLSGPGSSGPGSGSAISAFRNIVRTNVASADALRALRVGATAPLAGRVLLDWSGNLASSHHQKIQVFSNDGVVTAFTGGMDMHPSRVDGPPHTRGAWHDAAVRARGDAATALFETVVTRWREAATLSPNTFNVGAGARPYNPPPLVPLTPPAPRSVTPASPSTSAQVVRSFPDSKEFGFIRNTPWATLPRSGVHETVNTFRTAIAAAQRYIYIEDQGFNAVDRLFPSLVAALRRGVKVIALLPGAPDPGDGVTGPVNLTLSAEVRNGILAKLTPAQQSNLAVWGLTAITVHSKLMLIDDEFLEIGSANFMDRSMNFTLQGDDTEATACAVSTSPLVTTLRTDLWAEHLRTADPAQRLEVEDLGRSLGFWRSSWGTGLSFPTPSSPLRFIGPGSRTGGVPGGGGGSPILAVGP